MYKQIGFQFDDIPEEQSEALHYFIRAMEEHYQINNLTQHVNPPSGKRSSARLKISDCLPEDLSGLTIWFMYQNRFRKCLIKDISETGAGVILPFDDRSDFFKRERPFTVLIDLGECYDSSTYDTPRMDYIVCKGVVKYDKVLDLNNSSKEALSRYNSEVHPVDRGFASTAKPTTIHYQ